MVNGRTSVDVCNFFDTCMVIKVGQPIVQFVELNENDFEMYLFDDIKSGGAIPRSSNMAEYPASSEKLRGLACTGNQKGHPPNAKVRCMVNTEAVRNETVNTQHADDKNTNHNASTMQSQVRSAERIHGASMNTWPCTPKGMYRTAVMPSPQSQSSPNLCSHGGLMGSLPSVCNANHQNPVDSSDVHLPPFSKLEVDRMSDQTVLSYFKEGPLSIVQMDPNLGETEKQLVRRFLLVYRDIFLQI